MDVTNEQRVSHVVKQVVDTLGRIDILVNNAGIYPRCELVEMSDDFLRKMFDVNVFGMFTLSSRVRVRELLGSPVPSKTVLNPDAVEQGQIG